MADIALALQLAIETALEGMSAPDERTGVGNVLVGLHDHPPADAPMPFVSLDRHEIRPDDTLDEPADRHTIELAVWSQYRGSRQVQAIMTTIRDRLHDTEPALDAGQCVQCRVTSRVTQREEDGITYRGTVTIEALTAQEEV